MLLIVLQWLFSLLWRIYTVGVYHIILKSPNVDRMFKSSRHQLVLLGLPCSVHFLVCITRSWRLVRQNPDVPWTNPLRDKIPITVFYYSLHSNLKFCLWKWNTELFQQIYFGQYRCLNPVKIGWMRLHFFDHKKKLKFVSVEEGATLNIQLKGMLITKLIEFTFKTVMTCDWRLLLN